MTRRKMKAAAPEVDMHGVYPPGHFTQGVTSAKFLVGWAPAQHARSTARNADDARRGVDAGKAFGGRATMGLPGTPKGPKPGRM